MVKILVTGGAGFIGSHLSVKLAEKGHEVYVLDNLDPYYSPEIKKKNVSIIKEAGCTFVQGSILDYKLLKEVMGKGVEYIFHEAAQPGVRISIEDPFKPNEVNVRGTLNILMAAKETGAKQVINASSSCVYGEVELPFKEDCVLKPISPYGVSKLAAEHYCRVFYEIYGLPTVSLRYFTVYGPRMRPDLAVNIFTKCLLEGREATILGDGKQTRDFTFIEDIVDGNLKVMGNSKCDGEAFNIGSGRRVDILKLYSTLKEITGSDLEPKYDKAFKGDAPHTLADISKARKLIGYDPKTRLEEGLKKYVEWFKANQ